MLKNLAERMAVALLFLMPNDDEFERGDGLTALNAWHDQRYDRYNDAEDMLIRAKLITRHGHGNGYTYRLTQKGKDVRIKIRDLIGG